jgi:hypothetical protein
MPRALAQPRSLSRSTRPSAPRVAAVPAGWRAHWLPLAFLAVLAAALYMPCLDGPFVYDDPNGVSQSTLIRSLFPLGKFIQFSTRPFTDFSLAVDYAIGGLKTWPFHLTNVLLHALNGLLWYGIAWATFSSAPLERRYGTHRRALAWAAAALFVAHPLASESVAYISSRSEVLVGFWILVALGSFIVAAGSGQRPVRRAAAVLVPVATAAGLASKEIAVTVPLVLLLYDWLFLAGGRWQRTRVHGRLIALSLLPLAIGGAFLLLRSYLNPSPMGDYAATAGLGFDRFSGREYLLTQFGVIVHYLVLVVLPIGQTFDYDWPLARTPVALGVVVPFALLLALVVIAVRATRRQPLFTFAVGWTLLILAPTSSVMPIADLAVERRMYLPLAGLMLLAAAWLWELVQRLPAAWRTPRTYVAVVAVPLIACGALTWVRASLWGDPVALHEDGVAKTPNNPRVRLNLGVTYLNLRQQQRAYETLLVAKVLFDRHESLNAFPRIGAFIKYNLGAVLFERGEIDRAEPELKRSLELGGQYLALRPMAYMLLSRIAAQRDDWSTAVADMQEALKYRDDPDWWVDLAEMQRGAGDMAAARTTLQRTLQAYPGQARAAALLARMDAGG